MYTQFLFVLDQFCSLSNLILILEFHKMILALLSCPATRHYTVRKTSFQQKKADFAQQCAGAKSNKIIKYKIITEWQECTVYCKLL
jgi:hypothetical protein